MKRWLPLFIIIALMSVAYAFDLHNKVNLATLQDNKELLLSYVSQNPIMSVLGFMLLYCVCVALSLPIATLLTLTSGFLFGQWFGTLYVVIAATIGATIIFLIARSSFGQTLREKAGGLYKKVESNMSDNAIGYMFFMRLVPLFPFALVNIVPALFNVRTRAFVLTTFLGIIPGSFVYVNLGEQLGDITSLSDLVSIETLLAFVLLGLFALLPTLYKQVRNRNKG